MNVRAVEGPFLNAAGVPLHHIIKSNTTKVTLTTSFDLQASSGTPVASKEVATMAGAQEDSQAKILDGSKPGSQQRRVYFAGSIRGGRDDAELYASIVSHMQSLGVNVLTEHVADPALSAAGEVRSCDLHRFGRRRNRLLAE